MTRKSYIQDPITLELVERDQYVRRAPAGPFVFGDIQPYISQQTGEEISSRSTHRDHLRQHRLVEIGNETKHLMQPRESRTSSVRNTVIEAFKRHS